MALTGLLARTGFNVPNQDDIDGLALDGDDQPTKAVGNFEKHPASENTIAVRSSHAEPLGLFDVSKYTIPGVTGLDPAEHATEAVLRFPSFDTFTPGSPCHSGACAGENPDRCGYPAIITPLDYYTIWFQRPTLGDVADLSVQTTLPDGTYCKVEVHVNADGTGALYFTITPPSGPSTVGPHSLRPSFALDDFCNFLTISIDQAADGNLLTVSGPGNAFTSGTSETSLGTPSHSVTGATLNAYASSGSGFSSANESTEMEVCVRFDPTTDTKYNLDLAFDHLFADPEVTLYLFETVAGVERLLTSGAATAFHDTPTAVKLEVSRDNVLTASWRGAVLFTFNLLTDLADEDGELATMIASGRPGITATGPLTAGWQAIEQVSVYGTSEVTCGDPDDPGGGGFPAQPVLGYARENKAWHEFPIAVPDVQTGVMQVKANALFRLENGLEVYWNAGWRAPAANRNPEIHGDPGECIRGDLGFPIGDPGVPAAPLTGRIFELHGMPASLINSLGLPFTAVGQPMDPGHMLANIVTAAARGGAMLGTPGGYSKFCPGGHYSQSIMNDWIDAWIPHAGTLLAAQAAGSFYAWEIFDDFTSPNLWPPSGISFDEINRVCNRIKTNIGAVRTIIRGKPSQLVGGSFPGLDVCDAAWHQSLGTPDQFYDQESNANARIGFKDILWAFNGAKGANGLQPLSPAQVYACGVAFTQSGVRNHGIGAWDYRTSWLGEPGMSTVLVQVHNMIAAMP